MLSFAVFALFASLELFEHAILWGSHNLEQKFTEDSLGSPGLQQAVAFVYSAVIPLCDCT